MKKLLIAILFVLSLPVGVFAQTGKVHDNLSLQSTILNGERKYAIYLPPDYETSERSYPVLYLLHGGGDDQTGWVQFGEVLRITDKAIQEGVATPMIIVMPDANMHIPRQIEHGFRRKSNSHSDGCRTRIPTEVEQLI